MKSQLTYEKVKAAYEIFNNLQQPNRLKIIEVLHRNTECTVGELCEHMQLDQGLVSHHLRILTKIGLLDVRKNGKYTHYSINYMRLAQVRTVISDLADK
jgi:ArsR family transcriptional regulator